MRKFFSYSTNFVLTYAGALAALLLFSSSFSLVVGSVPLLMLPATAILLAAFSIRRLKPVAVLGCIGLILLWCYMRRAAIADGFGIIASTICERFNMQFGTGFFFDVVLRSSSLPARCVEAAITALALVLLLLMSWNYSGIMNILVTMPLFLVSIALTADPNKLWLFLLLLYWLALLMTASVRSADDNLAARLSVIMIPTGALLLVIIALICPEKDYERPEWSDKLYSSIQGKIEMELGITLPVVTSDIGIAAVPGLPGMSATTNTEEIDLSKVGPQRFSGRTMLTIKTDAVGVRYLRGFSMSRYTGEAWVNDSPENYDAIAPIPPYSSYFSEDAMAYEPLALAAYAVGGQEAEIEITAVSDISGIQFIPYFTKVLGAQDLSDSVCYISTINDANSYNIAFSNAGYTVSELLPPAETGASEMIYRDYVYKTYLNVPEYLAEELRSIAADAGIYDGMPRSEIADCVAEYVSTVATYSLDTPRTPDDKDFILYFLTESRQGYCMHFASAATTMLQSLGIPARYVTGYMKSVPETMAGVTINVEDRNAHAWVEVYFDGIGWLPYEVTGGSGAYDNTDDMPMESSAISPSPKPTPAADPTTPDATDSSKAKDAPRSGYGWLIIPLIVLLLSAFMVIRRAMIIASRNAKISSESRNKAAIHTWLYIEKLCRYGYSPPEDIRHAALKARFSQHVITEEELNLLKDYSDFLVNEIENSLSLPRKLIFRYIRALN